MFLDNIVDAILTHKNQVLAVSMETGYNKIARIKDEVVMNCKIKVIIGTKFTNSLHLKVIIRVKDGLQGIT